MEKRYELLTGHRLYQIKALVAIPEYQIEPGDLGGFIESEDNLPQSGTGWIDGGSMVEGKSVVFSGLVDNNSEINGFVSVEGYVSESILTGDLIVEKNVRLHHCKIEGGMIKGETEIRNSQLQNVDIHSSSNLSNVNVKAMQSLVIWQPQDWHDVELTIEDGEIYSEGLWRGVQVEVDSFYSYQETHFENVKRLRQTSIPSRFAIGDVLSPASEKTILLGKSAENPILAETNELRLYNVTLVGKIDLKGNLTLKDSQMNGNITIDYAGKIIRSTFFGFSSLLTIDDEDNKRIGTRYRGRDLYEIHLVDDEIYFAKI